MSTPGPDPSRPARPAQTSDAPGGGTRSGAFSDASGAHRAPPPGSPEGLQAPWRLEYLEAMGEQEKRPGPPTASVPTPSSSFLHDYWRDVAGDVKNHVIVRSGDGLILLNAFPYASGHLLAALGEPRPTLLDYSAQQRAALWRLVDCAADLVTRTLEPQGINIGLNQGRAAGAGVPGHLHVHLVPRWGGDTNFITVVGQVRIIPASLETMAERYRRTWATVADRWK